MGNPSIGSAELLVTAGPTLSSPVVLMTQMAVEMAVMAVLSTHAGSAAVPSACTDTAVSRRALLFYAVTVASALAFHRQHYHEHHLKSD